ncbi:nuclear transport factor 2 family protein [Nonomuraea sp. LPB2021202275-12-8]|uniref:nuclear transport factor 2 family protein n=1 Tax=Nonomuraea sp. LPB2021202275-12-8 TaxID=3120159 RepID=UPI00300D0D00
MIAFPGADRPLPDGELRRRREKVVREHMRAEMAGDLDACLATMPGGADYAIKATGREHHGDEQVRELLTDLLGAFPDLRLVPELVHHHAVVVAQLTGQQPAADRPDRGTM